MIISRIKTELKILILMVAAAGLAACAKAPTQELADTENAISAAIQKGAEEYAMDDLVAAQDDLADAKRKISSQDFNGARTSLMDAKAKADTAISAVETNKAAAKAAIDEKMVDLKKNIEAVVAQAAKAKGKGGDALQAQSAELNALWTDVQSAYDSGNYKTGLSKAADAQMKLDELKATLAAIPAKGKSGKKK